MNAIRRWISALLHLLGSKIRPVAEVSLIAAEYTLTPFPEASIKEGPSGDMFEVRTFTVKRGAKELGKMTIWFNRYGAFCNFTDTRKW